MISELGILKDSQYDCIITTASEEGSDAEVLSFTYLGDDNIKIQCRKTKTLENILKASEYVANLTQDSLIFTKVGLNCISDEDFDECNGKAVIKNSDSFIIVDGCEVACESPDNYIITGHIKDVIINNENAKAFNRGLYCILETLTNYSRYKIVDDDKRKEYMDRLIENERTINQFSDEKTKKVMAYLKSEYEKN